LVYPCMIVRRVGTVEGEQTRVRQLLHDPSRGGANACRVGSVQDEVSVKTEADCCCVEGSAVLEIDTLSEPKHVGAGVDFGHVGS